MILAYTDIGILLARCPLGTILARTDSGIYRAIAKFMPGRSIGTKIANARSVPAFGMKIVGKIHASLWHDFCIPAQNSCQAVGQPRSRGEEEAGTKFLRGGGGRYPENISVNKYITCGKKK